MYIICLGQGKRRRKFRTTFRAGRSCGAGAAQVGSVHGGQFCFLPLRAKSDVARNATDLLAAPWLSNLGGAIK